MESTPAESVVPPENHLRHCLSDRPGTGPGQAKVPKSSAERDLTPAAVEAATELAAAIVIAADRTVGGGMCVGKNPTIERDRLGYGRPVHIQHTATGDGPLLEFIAVASVGRKVPPLTLVAPL